MFKKIITAIAILVCSFCSTMSVAALQAGDIVMSATPSERTIDLYPGATYDGVVKVLNGGRLDYDFSVEAKPFQVNPDDYAPDFETDNAYTRLHNWITFPETTYHLDIDGQVEVPFHIEVPEDIPGGGQYAAIIIRAHTPDENNSMFKLIPQIAALIYGHIEGGETRESGEIVSHTIPEFLMGEQFQTTATVRNTGNVDFRVRQSIEIRDFFTNREVVTPDSVAENGEPVGYNNMVVLPDTERSSTLYWAGAPQLGIFRVRQTISFLEQEETYEQIVIFCPMWLIVLAIVLVALMILWIVIRLLTRKRHQPQVF